MGDINQLPPINEDSSDTFLINERIHLNESMRYKDGIYKICNYLLNNMNKKLINIDEYITKDVKKYNNIVEYYKDIIKNKDLDYKILCWTNARCLTINKIIRDKIYGKKCDRFCEKEKLIVKNYFMDMDSNIYTSNEELIVESVKQKKILMKDFVFIPKKYINDIESINVYELILEKGTKIYVVKTKYEKVVDRILKRIKFDAIECKNNNDRVKSIHLWEMYYKIKELFMPSIDYSYAITIHRSQGSDWNNVYVEMKDIMKNRRVKERNKLLYVAFSRAIKNLVINCL